MAKTKIGWSAYLPKDLRNYPIMVQPRGAVPVTEAFVLRSSTFATKPLGWGPWRREKQCWDGRAEAAEGPRRSPQWVELAASSWGLQLAVARPPLPGPWCPSAQPWHKAAVELLLFVWSNLWTRLSFLSATRLLGRTHFLATALADEAGAAAAADAASSSQTSQLYHTRAKRSSKSNLQQSAQDNLNPESSSGRGGEPSARQDGDTLVGQEEAGTTR